MLMRSLRTRLSLASCELSRKSQIPDFKIMDLLTLTPTNLQGPTPCRKRWYTGPSWSPSRACGGKLRRIGSVWKRPRSHGTDGACVRASGGVPLGTGTECTTTFLCSLHENRTRPCGGDTVGGGLGPSERQASQPGQDLPEASDGGVAHAGAHWDTVAGGGGRAQRRARVPPSERHTNCTRGSSADPGHWLLPPSYIRAPACLLLTVRPKVTSDSRKKSVANSILSRGQQMCYVGHLHDGRKLLTVNRFDQNGHSCGSAHQETHAGEETRTTPSQGESRVCR